jgi:hypothetical protein
MVLMYPGMTPNHLLLGMIVMTRMLHAARRWVYEKGFRPKLGDILYSPSLSWQYTFKDANLPEAFAKGIKRAGKQMTQKIQFECDRPISTKELHAVSELASKFDQHDLRVVDDPTNIKVYVGPYFLETHRYWIVDGRHLEDALVEQDLAVGEDDPDWQAISWDEAYEQLRS